MIPMFLLKPLWAFIRFLVGLEFRFMAELPNWYDDFLRVIKIGLAIFPLDVWIVVIGNLVVWMGIHLTGAVIEWIYKKIPGVS